MENTLNIIIGAGFSYLAGLPLGNALKSKFDRDLREQILRYSGSEWAWKEGKDSATINNGSIGADWISYSYVLNEVLEAYKTERGAFNDYEDFYQFIKDHSGNDQWYRPMFDRAKTKMYSEQGMQSPNEFFDPIFSMPNTFLIEEIINYLIADLLWTTKTDDELLAAYKPFIEYIKTFDEVNIFTLNHDLLLERLFKIAGLAYCEGFSTKKSILKYQDSALPTFQCAFDSAPIKIHKLHGSVDTFLFAHCEENGAVLTRTGQYSYFKPINYQSKHYVERIDPATNDVIQHFSADTIVPRFITGNGENKKVFIEADYMYSQLYSRFKEIMKTCKNLLIVGYSYRDEHVNDVLKLFTKTDGPNVINLNPGDAFKYQVPSAKEIKSFSELSLKQK